MTAALVNRVFMMKLRVWNDMRPVFVANPLSCCRFREHPEKVFDETGAMACVAELHLQAWS